jgi:hypothetical protein
MSDNALIDQILREARALATFTVGRGMPVPVAAIKAVANAPATASEGEVDLTRLLAAHQALARLVRPATPRDIETLVDRGGDELASAKKLMVKTLAVALVSLVGFLAVSTSEYVNNPMYGDIFTSHGLPLLVNEIFFLCAAGLGASFWILMEAFTQVRTNDELVDGSLNYWNQFRVTSQFWLRFILGLVAGMILATVMDIQLGSDDGASSHMTSRYSAALLALLGGFSARVVFKILYRAVIALDSMIANDSAPESRAPARDQEPLLLEIDRIEQERARGDEAEAEDSDRPELGPGAPDSEPDSEPEGDPEEPRRQGAPSPARE